MNYAIKANGHFLYISNTENLKKELKKSRFCKLSKKAILDLSDENLIILLRTIDLAQGLPVDYITYTVIEQSKNLSKLSLVK